MNDQSNDSPAELQSKLRAAKSLCLDLLLPKPEILQICDDIGHEFRDRVYNPMIVVWMFITQVLSADHGWIIYAARARRWFAKKSIVT